MSRETHRMADLQHENALLLNELNRTRVEVARLKAEIEALKRGTSRARS